MAKTNSIAEGGLGRLLAGQREMKPLSLEKYEAELAKAGPEEKKAILERMEKEAERHRKMASHKPSAGALW